MELKENFQKSRSSTGDFTPSEHNIYIIDNMDNIMEPVAYTQARSGEAVYFGSNSSVFKITDSQVPGSLIENLKNEGFHFEESEGVANELAEIGIVVDSLQEFAEAQPFEMRDTSNKQPETSDEANTTNSHDTNETNVMVPVHQTRSQQKETNNVPVYQTTSQQKEIDKVPVHPVALKKSRPAPVTTHAIQTAVPDTQVTTLLDISSIGELKRIWSKSDKVTKKSLPNATKVKADVKPHFDEENQIFEISKQREYLKTARLVGPRTSLKHFNQSEDACSSFQKQANISDVHIKDCEVSLVRVEHLRCLTIGNLKFDLTVPKISENAGMDQVEKENEDLDREMWENNVEFSDRTEEAMLKMAAKNLNTEIDKRSQEWDGDYDEKEDINDQDYAPSEDENDEDYKPGKKQLRKSAAYNTKAKRQGTGSKVSSSGKKVKGTRIGRPPVLGHFKCKVCKFTANEKNLVDKHYYAEHRLVLHCEHCDKVFKSHNSLLEHMAFKHDGGKPFKCDHEGCPYASKCQTDLKHHKAKHETELKHVCKLCGWRTKWKKNIRHHFMLKHNDVRKFKCHICEFAAKRSSDLKDHLYRHSDDKPLECKLCHFRVKTNFELKSHMLIHTNERPFRCTYPGCTRATKTKSDLTKHQIVHQTERPFSCRLCGRSYKNQGALNKHLRYIHVDTKKFKCDICGKLFKSRSSLKKHMVFHSGIKPFECPVCQWKFTSKNNLDKHLVTHDVKNRPFPCPLCPHTAKQQDHLLAHIGSVHGNEYAYVCELCRKPFKRYMQLRLHYQRMHTKNDVENLQKNVPVDLALLKMEMELEMEKKISQKRKKRIKSKSQEGIEVKEEVSDIEYGYVGNDGNEISDIRLNESTGEIEVVTCKRVPKVGKKQPDVEGTEGNMDTGDKGLEKLKETSGSFFSESPKNSQNILMEETKIIHEEAIGVGAENTNKIAKVKENLQSLVNENETKEGEENELNAVQESPMENIDNETVTDTKIEESISLDIGMETKCTQIAQSSELMENHEKQRQVKEVEHSNEKEDNVVVVDDDNENTINSTEADLLELEKTDEDDKIVIVKNDVVTVGVYDNFRLPLATKGFQFNYDKNGTKPMKAWFMDLSLMDPTTAEKHMKHRRRLGLLPPIPRGHPPKGYKQLKNFVSSRKKKLAENIKKAKFIRDLGLVSRRKSKARSIRFKGNYAQFETVDGEDLSFSQVQERLPQISTNESEAKESITGNKISCKQKSVKTSPPKHKHKTESSRKVERGSKKNPDSNKKLAAKEPKRKKATKSTKTKTATLLLSSEKKQNKKPGRKPVDIRKPLFLQPAGEKSGSKDSSERDSFTALKNILSEFSQPDTEVQTDKRQNKTASVVKKSKTTKKQSSVKNIKSKKRKVTPKDEEKPKYKKKYVPVRMQNKRKLNDTQSEVEPKKKKPSKSTEKKKSKIVQGLKKKLKSSEIKRKLKVKIASRAKMSEYTETDTVVHYHSNVHVPVENTQMVMVYPVVSIETVMPQHAPETSGLENMVVTVNEDFTTDEEEVKPTEDALAALGESGAEEDNSEVNSSENSDKEAMQKEYIYNVTVKEEPETEVSSFTSLNLDGNTN